MHLWPTVIPMALVMGLCMGHGGAQSECSRGDPEGSDEGRHIRFLSSFQRRKRPF